MEANVRISSKGRYGVAAMISMAQNQSKNDCITIISIAEILGISKIYLEQVFSLLKRAELVNSIKGAQGGYKLSRPAQKITAAEILRALEVGLFEKTENSVSPGAGSIDLAMEALLWNRLDAAIQKTLETVTLDDLVSESGKHKKGMELMFYI
jgi:Rrf2 family cysteine metabolism transcriptional repressor